MDLTIEIISLKIPVNFNHEIDQTSHKTTATNPRKEIKMNNLTFDEIKKLTHEDFTKNQTDILEAIKKLSHKQIEKLIKLPGFWKNPEIQSALQTQNQGEEIHKITTGFVIQKWNKKTKEFLGQEFVTGDEVDYEDENGNPIDDEEPEYKCFTMEQNPESGWTA